VASGHYKLNTVATESYRLSLLDFLPRCGTATEFEPETLMTPCCILKPSNLQSVKRITLVPSGPIVHKRRNNRKPDRSSQIASPNDKTTQGTLPSVERGCIFKSSQDYKATPAPSPLLSMSSHSPPSGGFNPRTAYRSWRPSSDYAYGVSSGI